MKGIQGSPRHLKAETPPREKKAVQRLRGMGGLGYFQGSVTVMTRVKNGFWGELGGVKGVGRWVF